MPGEELNAPVLILQHVDCEPAAAYGDVLVGRGLEPVAVHLDEGEPVPDWREFSAIVAMGGPMSVNETEGNPWLAPELELISEAVRAGIPFWGVCLGAQLLSAALGGRVTPTGSPEIGILPVDLSPDAGSDPVFGKAPDRFLAFHWHSDTYELPEGARHLASSRANFQQAFAIERAYGLQFHLEVGPELAERWADIPAYANSLTEALGPGALDSLIAELRTHRDALLGLAEYLMTRWLDATVFAESATAATRSSSP